MRPAGSRLERGRRHRWLPVLVSAVLLAVLLALLDLEVAAALLGRADLRWVGAVVAVQLLDRLLMAWKWWLLIDARSPHLTFGGAFKIYYVSSFQGFLLPFGIGPDVLRFLKLRRLPIPSETVVASLVVERVLGLLATALLAGAAAALLVTRVGDRLPGWVVPLLAAVALLTLLAVALLFHPRIRTSIREGGSMRWLERWLPVRAYIDAIGSYGDDRPLLLRFGAWTVVEQFAYILSVWFAARALAVPLGLLDCVAFVPISTLLERLPLSVLGLGVREGTFALFLAPLGVGPSTAIVLGLLVFFLFVLTVLPAAVWAAWKPDGRSPPGSRGDAAP